MVRIKIRHPLEESEKMNSVTRKFFILGALFAASGVLLGAFAAHALKQSLTTGMLGVFETGVRYQMYHAFALFVVGWVAQLRQDRLVVNAGWLFVVGILLFSGSLYFLSVFSMPRIVFVTPFGGVAFILGWVSLVIDLFRVK